MSIGVNCFTSRECVKCVNILAWSPDGRFLAAGSSDGTVHIWETGTWKVVLVLDIRNRRKVNSHGQDVSEAVYLITWSLDGKTIQVDRGDQWDIYTGILQTGDVMSTPALQLVRAHVTFGGVYGIVPKVHLEGAGPAHWHFHQDAYILAYCMDESPDGQQIAYGGYDHAVWIWNVKQLKMVQSYTPHAASVMCVAWSSDGNLIASGSYDKSMQICEAATGKVQCTCIGHENVALDTSWSPDGQLLASSSWDKTARVWNALTGECLYKYEGHTGPINSIAWSPDGCYLASGSWDHTVQVWEAR